MIVEVDKVIYETTYFPFFRTEKHDDFEVWNLRLPSGNLEEVIVFEVATPLNCLTEYAEFLIREYVLEDDEMLTPRAIELKKDLEELFCKHES
jgi:hypothetical protein